MFLFYSLFMFRIVNKYNNEYDQNYIHYRTSKVGSNEYVCYKPEKEQHSLHNVLKTQKKVSNPYVMTYLFRPTDKAGTTVIQSRKIMEFDGMDLRPQNMSVIYEEIVGKTQKINTIYETSKTYKMNIHQLDNIKKNGILHPPEQKTQIYVSNIFSGLDLGDW